MTSDNDKEAMMAVAGVEHKQLLTIADIEFGILLTIFLSIWRYASVYVLFIGVEISQDSMCDVFMEASTVDWHKVVETFPSFNRSCLIQVLLLWHEGEDCKDPWIIWRKLASLIESMKNDDPNHNPDDDHTPIPKQVKSQLGIGYELRLKSGVGM